MIKIKKTLILSLLLLTSCEMDVNDRDYALYMVNEIDYYMRKDLAENKRLYLIGTGGRAMLGIERNSLSFSYYRDKELKIEEARKDMVDIINKYLQEINQKKELRPFLRNYPFNAKNIEITLFVMTEKADNPPHGFLDVIKAEEGVISYYTAPFSVKSEPILEETFEEALEKVQALANKSE
jgi:hypothetical protein